MSRKRNQDANQNQTTNQDELIPDHDVVEDTPTVHKATNVQPKIQWKGHEEFRHDLFKLEPEKFLKNVSYKWGLPELAGLEHTHMFHTFDSNGRKQHKSSSQAGHYHEVKKMEVLEDGSLHVEFGPALARVTKDPETCEVYYKPEYQSPAYYDKRERKLIVDDHTHTATYLRSENLTPAKSKKLAQQTSTVIQQSNPMPQPMSRDGFTEV